MPEHFRVLGTEIDEFSPAAQEMGDSLRIVPRVDDRDHATELERICADENVTAVFPLIDPDVQALSRINVPCAALAQDAAEVVSDKWLTYQWLQERGIPTVDTWLPQESGPPNTYPVFMKPRRGSGGKDAYAIKNEFEYDFFGRYIPDPVAQAYLPGGEITADAIVGRRGDILGLALRERLVVRGGEVSRGRLIVDDIVEAMVKNVVGALDPRGPVTVQGMYDEDQAFRVTEINGRMGGGLPLAIAGGLPVAESLVSSWRGLPVPSLGPKDLKPGLQMARFDQSVFW
nr:ATP-grasp domain-containing protein [Ornithinimicrobium sp. CNJ-824]